MIRQLSKSGFSTGRLRFALIFVPVCFVIGAKWSGSKISENNPETKAKFAERHRGVSWVAGREPVRAEDLERLKAHSVNWIVQMPFGWQPAYNSPEVVVKTSGRIMWGESDAGLEETTRLAHSHGIKTLLKPHIWLRGRNDGKWRSDIEMSNEADWLKWFANYGQFILHYAELAERLDIEILCIGTELHMTVLQRPQDWRKLITEVRKVYSGKLVYAANWYREYEEITFWDDLDFIGVQGYFPLTQNENPTVDELVLGWQPHIQAIERIHKQFNKPIMFTEIGYRSEPNAAIEPWKWPARGANEMSESGMRTQQICYDAFFQAFWDKPWFAGCYIWKWYPNPNGRGARNAIDFTPQNKPAESVLAKWYKSTN